MQLLKIAIDLLRDKLAPSRGELIHFAHMQSPDNRLAEVLTWSAVALYTSSSVVSLLNPSVKPPYTSDPAEVDTRCISGARASCASARFPAAPSPSKAAPSTPRLKASLAARGNVIIQLCPPPPSSSEEGLVSDVLLWLTVMSPVRRDR